MTYSKYSFKELPCQNEKAFKGLRQVGSLGWICFIRVENLPTAFSKRSQNTLPSLNQKEKCW